MSAATASLSVASHSLFPSDREAAVFARLRAGDFDAEARDPVMLRPLGALCTPLALRPGFTDAIAFEHAFVGRRHLPPFRLRPGARILDLGCGPGYSSASFAARDRTCRVLGVELDPASAELAGRNGAAFAGRVRIVHGAAWGETGHVAIGFGGGGTERDAWARRVVQLDAYPGMPKLRAMAGAPAFSMDALIDASGFRFVDHVHMDIAGSEAAVFDPPARWLARVGSIRVHVSAPTRIERVESRLVEQGLIVKLDPRNDRVVVGCTRAFAAEQPRWPRDADRIEEPPPPY